MDSTTEGERERGEKDDLQTNAGEDEEEEEKKGNAKDGIKRHGIN